MCSQPGPLGKHRNILVTPRTQIINRVTNNVFLAKLNSYCSIVPKGS